MKVEDYKKELEVKIKDLERQSIAACFRIAELDALLERFPDLEIEANSFGGRYYVSALVSSFAESFHRSSCCETEFIHIFTRPAGFKNCYIYAKPYRAAWKGDYGSWYFTYEDKYNEAVVKKVKEYIRVDDEE